jgi:hypothetical protein
MRESGGKAERRLSRRQVIELAAAAALVLGSAAAFVRTRGYALPAGRQLVAMSPWQFVVVQHAARRIAAPDPEAEHDRSVPDADDVDAAGFVDGWLAKMQPRVRRDFGRFLAYVEHLAPARAGFASRFTRLGPQAQDRVLVATEASSSDLLRAGFDGLKSLVLMGYYRDSRAWGIVGYDGPLVGRPPFGWREGK